MTIKEAAAALETAQDELKAIDQQLSPLQVKREIIRQEVLRLRSTLRGLMINQSQGEIDHLAG